MRTCVISLRGSPTGVPWEAAEQILPTADQNRPFPKSEHRQGSSRCGGGRGREAGPFPRLWAQPGSSLSYCLSPGAQASFVGHLLPTEPPSCPIKVARPETVTALPLSTAVRSEKGLHETTWSNSFFLAWLGASL